HHRVASRFGRKGKKPLVLLDTPSGWLVRAKANTPFVPPAFLTGCRHGAIAPASCASPLPLRWSAVQMVGEQTTANPAVLHFDLSSQAFKHDPFPTLARMRDSGQVIRTRLPLLGTTWLATTHEAVNDLLRDHHRFVLNPATAGNRVMGSLLRW